MKKKTKGNKKLNILEKYIIPYNNKLSKNKFEILLFGPGKDNTDYCAKLAFKKRLQIQKTLTNHNVNLPEYIISIAKQNGVRITNELLFEENLVEQADMCFMLLVPKAPGVKTEFDYFSQRKHCAMKLYIFYIGDYASTFSYRNILTLYRTNGVRQLKKITESDIKKCNVLTQIENIIKRIVIAESIYPTKRYNN